MVLQSLLDKHLYPVLLHKYFVLGEVSIPDQLSFIGFQFAVSTNQKLRSNAKSETWLVSIYTLVHIIDIKIHVFQSVRREAIFRIAPPSEETFCPNIGLFTIW